METFKLIASDGYETEIRASSVGAAVREAERLVREGVDPNETRTTWVHVRLEDEWGDRATEFTVTVDPEAPECEAPNDALADASIDDLEDAWHVRAWVEGGHVWGRPFDLVGGLIENPGVQGNGAGVIIEEVCLRCGAARTIDTDATDPEDGMWGLRSVEYEVGRYSEEVEDMFSTLLAR